MVFRHMNYGKLEDGEELIFHCLEICFRGLDLEYRWRGTRLPSTKHYRHVVDIVSNSGGDETIADLLQAWIVYFNSHVSPELLKLWAAHLSAYSPSGILERLHPSTWRLEDPPNRLCLLSRYWLGMTRISGHPQDLVPSPLDLLPP